MGRALLDRNAGETSTIGTTTVDDKSAFCFAVLKEPHPNEKKFLWA